MFPLQQNHHTSETMNEVLIYHLVEKVAYKSDMSWKWKNDQICTMNKTRDCMVKFVDHRKLVCCCLKSDIFTKKNKWLLKKNKIYQNTKKER